MKVFNSIILLLILVTLGVLTFLTWQIKYEDQPTKLPIEAFQKTVQKHNPNPIKVLGWEQIDNGVVLYADLKAPDTDSFYQYTYYFMHLNTPNGKKWFYQHEGTLLEVENK